MTTNESNEQRTRAGALGRFLGYVKQRRETVGNSLHITASQVNARPLVQPALFAPAPGYNGDQGGNGPNLFSDPIRQSSFDGIGHIGIARIPKFVSTYNQTAWENQTFIANNLDMRAGASIVPGRQAYSYERSNIDVPQALAYGSLFSYQPEPYGYI